MLRPFVFATTIIATLALSGCVVPCPTAEPCTYPVAEPYPAYAAPVYAPDYFGPVYAVTPPPVIIIIRPRPRLRRWP